MAEITYFAASATSASASSVAGVVEATWAQLQAAGFAAGDDIIVLAGGSIGGSASNAVAGKADLLYAISSKQEITREPRATSTYGDLGFFFCHRDTVATNDTVILRVHGVNGKTGYVGGGWLLILKLDDLSSDDWFYEQKTHTSFTPDADADCYTEDTAGSNGALPDGDWLIIGNSSGSCSTVGGALYHQLADETSSPSALDPGYQPTGNSYNQDTSESVCAFNMVCAPFSSDTGGARYVCRSPDADYTITDTRIFGLRLNAFDEHSIIRGTTTLSSTSIATIIYAAVGPSPSADSLFITGNHTHHNGENRKDFDSYLSHNVGGSWTQVLNQANASDTTGTYNTHLFMYEQGSFVSPNYPGSRISVDDYSPAPYIKGFAAWFTWELSATGPTIIDKTGANALKDSLSVTDPSEAERFRERELLDTSELEDFLNRTYSWRKQLADAIAEVTDTGVCQKVKAQKLLDAISAYDSAVTTYERNRALLDVAALEDATVLALQWRKALTDDMAVSDAAIEVYERFRALADAFAVEDNAVPTFVEGYEIVERALADSAALLDAIEAERKRYSQLADSVELNDAIAALRAHTQQLADYAAGTDATKTTRERYLQLADSAALIDAISTAIDREVTTLDDVPLEDAITKAYERNRALLDSAAITEDQARLSYQRYRAVIDALVASDAVVASYVPGAAVIDLTKLDSIGSMFDAFKARRLRWALLADQLDTLDTATALRSRERALLDTLVTDDAFGRKTAERVRTALDSAEVADAFIHRYLLDRTLSDSFAMFDNAIATYVYGAEIFTRELTDSLATADSFVKQHSWSKQLTSTLDLEDAIAELYQWRKQLGDSVDMEQLPARRRIVKEMLDAFWNLTDNAVATFVSGESVVNQEVLTDAVSLLSDAYVQEYMRWRGLLDSTNVNDAIKTIRELTLDDALSLSDLPLATRIRVQLLADSLPALDTAQARRNRLAELSDALAVTDAVQKRREELKTLADLLDTVDAIAPDRYRYRAIAEALLVSELPTLRRIYRSVLESLNVVDTAIPTYVPPGTVVYDKTLSDQALNIPDNVLVLRQFARELVETVITDDAYRAGRYRAAKLTDAIAELVSTALYYVTRRRILSESLLVRDAIKAGPQDYYRELLDVFDIYDVFEALRLRRRLLVDSPIEITDTARATYLAYIRARVRPILGIRSLFVKGGR